MIYKKLHPRRSFFTGGVKAFAAIFAETTMPQFVMPASAKEKTKLFLR